MEEFLNLRGVKDVLSNLKNLFSFKEHSHVSSDITDISNVLEQTHFNAAIAQESAIAAKDAIEIIDQKLNLASFKINNAGHLVYTDDTSYIFKIIGGRLTYSLSADKGD